MQNKFISKIICMKCGSRAGLAHFGNYVCSKYGISCHNHGWIDMMDIFDNGKMKDARFQIVYNYRGD